MDQRFLFLYPLHFLILLKNVHALHIGCNRKLWLNADDILYSALKVIKLFLEERLTRGNFPIVMQGINNNLFLVNGRIGCDENAGNFTYRNASVLDYSIFSLEMFEFYQDFEVVVIDPLFSDGHCLLRSVLRFDLFLPNEENIQSPPIKPNWKPEYCNDFIQHIDCTKINSLLTTWENTDISKETINFVTNQIGQIFENATSKAFPKPKHCSRPKNKQGNKP